MNRRNFIQAMVTAASVLGITKATAAPPVIIDHAKYDKAWDDFSATGLDMKEFQMLSAKILNKHKHIYKLDFQLGLTFQGQRHIEHYSTTFEYGDYAYAVAYYTQHEPDKNSRIVVKFIEREGIEEYRKWKALFHKEFS